MGPPFRQELGSQLPEGGPCTLPGQRGSGIDTLTGNALGEKGWAVAAFIPPAHTGSYAGCRRTGAIALPFHCSAIRLRLAGW